MSTPHQTTHCRLTGKHQIQLARDCQKTHPTKKYWRNQKQNMKKHYQKLNIKRSYHITTIYLIITTRTTGTTTPRIFLTTTQMQTESAA